MLIAPAPCARNGTGPVDGRRSGEVDTASVLTFIETQKPGTEWETRKGPTQLRLVKNAKKE